MRIVIVGGGPGGLYTALLLKKEWPTADVALYERNRPDDTFGFGVVFSDETLGNYRQYDRPSYEAIVGNFVYWDDVEIHFQGQRFRCAGNGFAGCSRQSLLTLLQRRCEELGVVLRFQCELGPEALTRPPLADCGLVVAADGADSQLRRHYQSSFGTTTGWGDNYFAWLGSTRPLDALTYYFKQSEAGPLVAHCYQYEPGRSTWVVEMPPATYFGLGLDRSDNSAGEHIPQLEALLADELDGHHLINNRSIWRRFRQVENQTWVRGRLALLGDAKATVHYSIGSGTKLAMEDAIALLAALRQSGGQVAPALAQYDSERREEVGKTQHSGNVSRAWFEALPCHWSLPPEQFAFGVMSRSKQITYEELIVRDPAFVRPVEHLFRQQARRQGFAVDDRTTPMFVPFRLGQLVLPNRVVVSPMAQYSAEDGEPNDWHFVHLTSRAVGGAGLVFVEMTCPTPEARITPGCTGLWNERQRDAFARIVGFIHQQTPAKVAMQLGHAGRKGSTQVGWLDENFPLPEGNWPLVSASPLPYYPESQTPAELTPEQMAEVIGHFVHSTRLAAEAGFDLLEIHMAHGYLLASFISPLTNRRGDAYGGPIEGRMRFPLELFRACRAAWPAERPMSVRISATDWAPGGLSEAEMVVAARLLKEAGADLIDVSTGQTVPDQRPVYGRMWQTPFAETIRQEVGIATMAVGAITTPDQVNTILLQGRADLVALARPHLSNPYFTLQAAAHYGERGQPWPRQYWPGRNQAYRLAERQRTDWLATRRALKPPPAGDDRPEAHPPAEPS
jgi:anthraniloyl-CoA monooxygenase